MLTLIGRAPQLEIYDPTKEPLIRPITQVEEGATGNGNSQLKVPELSWMWASDLDNGWPT